MNESCLNLLAKEILQIVPEGLSKVRFAKILYFVHKGLVQKNINTNADIKFIRMPLGPVPVGFKELINDEDINVVEMSTTALIYDNQVYTLKRKQQLNDLRIVEIKEILDS